MLKVTLQVMQLRIRSSNYSALVLLS